jgi:hypothetical protein
LARVNRQSRLGSSRLMPDGSLMPVPVGRWAI